MKQKFSLETLRVFLSIKVLRMYRGKDFSNGQMGSTSGATMQSYTAEEKEHIREALGRQLGPEFISKRKGPGYASVQYLEGWKAINLANEIFGPMGWCTELRGFQVDYIDGKEGSISLGLSCNVRVILKDGTYHEDIGYGSIDNCRSKSMAFDKCKKEAMTDGLKRALRQFGNALGNCLYDKDFLKQIQNVKSEPTPLDESRLFRRSTTHNENQIQPSNIYEKPQPQQQRRNGSAANGHSDRPATRQQRSRRRDSQDDDSFIFSDDVVGQNELDNTSNPSMRPELPDSDPEFDEALSPAELTKLESAHAAMSTQQEKEAKADITTNNNKNVDQSVQLPEQVPAEITFVSATSAEKIVDDPSLQKSMIYDTSYQGKNTSKSTFINHKKSIPIKRTDVKTSDILVEKENESTPVVAKRSFGLPLDKLPNKRLHK